MKHFGFSRQWIEVLLDDLHRLELLDWTRKNRQTQREYTIAISDDNDSTPDGKYWALTKTIRLVTTSIRAKTRF